MAESAAAAPPVLHRAGLFRRYASLVYEALILAALLLVAGFALSPFVSPGGASAGVIALPGPLGRALSFVALFALGAWFYAWCWSHGRRTLPMKTWRIALVGSDGARVTTRQALARYVAAWIGPMLALAVYAMSPPEHGAIFASAVFLLNWLWALVDPDRQFLHDRIARTRLVMWPHATAPVGATAPPPPR